MLVNTKPFFVVSEAIPANLSMGDETCPGVASPVTFTLSINDAPNGLASFGFRIAYDNAILTYGSFSNIVGSCFFYAFAFMEFRCNTRIKSFRWDYEGSLW